MILSQALLLSYPVTRKFQSPWFSYLVYAILFSGLCILIPLNCEASNTLSLLNANASRPILADTLTGYQVVSTVKDDFNFTQTFWYDGFLPMRKRRGQCDPKIMSTKESYFTKQGILQWTVQGFMDETARVYSNGQYAATPLDSACVLERMGCDVDVKGQSSVIKVDVVCRTGGRNIRITTTKTGPDVEVGQMEIELSSIRTTEEIIDYLYAHSLVCILVA